jgi:hypothetical protein
MTIDIQNQSHVMYFHLTLKVSVWEFGRGLWRRKTRNKTEIEGKRYNIKTKIGEDPNSKIHLSTKIQIEIDMTNHLYAFNGYKVVAMWNFKWCFSDRLLANVFFFYEKC